MSKCAGNRQGQAIMSIVAREGNVSYRTIALTMTEVDEGRREHKPGQSDSDREFTYFVQSDESL